MASSLFSMIPQTQNRQVAWQQPVPQTTPQIDPRIQEMYQILKFSKNPDATVQQMLSSNPALAPILGLARMSGGDLKTAFYNEAKRKGVDPNSILRMFN